MSPSPRGRRSGRGGEQPPQPTKEVPLLTRRERRLAKYGEPKPQVVATIPLEEREYFGWNRD